MRVILMSTFTDFIAFKSSLFKCNEIIYGFKSNRRVLIRSGINNFKIFKASTEKSVASINVS